MPPTRLQPCRFLIMTPLAQRPEPVPRIRVRNSLRHQVPAADRPVVRHLGGLPAQTAARMVLDVLGTDLGGPSVSVAALCCCASLPVLLPRVYGAGLAVLAAWPCARGRESPGHGLLLCLPALVLPAYLRALGPWPRPCPYEGCELCTTEDVRLVHDAREPGALGGLVEDEVERQRSRLLSSSVCVRASLGTVRSGCARRGQSRPWSRGRPCSETRPSPGRRPLLKFRACAGSGSDLRQRWCTRCWRVQRARRHAS